MDNLTTQLEQKHAIRILFVLLEEGQLKITELKEILRKPATTIYKALNILTELGLVEDKLTEWPVKRFLILTEKGKQVAQLLTEIEKLLLLSPAGFLDDH